MRFIKSKGIWVHKDIHADTSKLEEESNERWIPSYMLDIPKNVPTNDDSSNPMPTKEILTKIIKSAIKIVKEES